MLCVIVDWLQLAQVKIQSVVNSFEQDNDWLDYMKGCTTVSLWWTLLPRAKILVMILTVLIVLTTVVLNTYTWLQITLVALVLWIFKPGEGLLPAK